MQPLHDIRVLGVTVFLAGPFLSMNLARLGAEVIKVEVPGRGDPVRGNSPFAGPKGIHSTRQTEADISTPFLKRTQGVKSITLNLKHPEGRAAVSGTGKAIRCGARKSGAWRHATAGIGVRGGGGRKLWHRLLLDFWLRTNRTVRQPTGP